MKFTVPSNTAASNIKLNAGTIDTSEPETQARNSPTSLACACVSGSRKAGKIKSAFFLPSSFPYGFRLENA